MNVSPSQRWKLLGLACVAGLAGYMFLNAAGFDPVPSTQASAQQGAFRSGPPAAVQPRPSPQAVVGKPQPGGVVVKGPRPPAPPFSGPAGQP
jgi:hypothetical protein